MHVLQRQRESEKESGRVVATVVEDMSGCVKTLCDVCVATVLSRMCEKKKKNTYISEVCSV